MILDTVTICNRLREKDYASPNNKLELLRKKGEYIQVRHGLYETDRNTPPHLLACAIYGPSYLSFEYALSFYGLIPEKVVAFTSATMRKNRTKQFINDFGTYTYRDIPAAAFPHETVIKDYDGRGYQIATAEKAVCDMLYIQKPVYSVKALKELLFDNMRLDEDAFHKLDKAALIFLCPLYGRKNLNFLYKMISKEMK